MTFEPRDKERSKIIATQISNRLVLVRLIHHLENIEKILGGKATRSTVVNSRGEVKQRIIIEHD